MGPPDPILGLTDAFNKDTDPRKVNLGVGAYRDDAGKPYILPSVRTAEELVISQKLNKEYAGITGIKTFVDAAVVLALGKDSAALKENRVAATQTLSGTGACRVATEFLSRFAKSKDLYMPNPTWANHIPLAKDAGLGVKEVRYYDPKTCGLDMAGYIADINAAPEGSNFLLHACAHNPTGVDPTPEQWAEISDALKKKKHVIMLDSAYQGFASGSVEKDALPMRQLVKDGHNFLLCQSFAKNFGLYGERVGAFSVVCADTAERDRVESQIKILIRPMYSNPPIHGARIVSQILNDDKLRTQWLAECKGMADRIITMRTELKKLLHKNGSSRNWEHVTNQIGMFCYSGLTKAQVDTLQKDDHIYMTGNGRISMAGVTSGNVGYLAEAMAKVTK